MIVVSDTDVIHKLACCELLLEFLQYLKCPPNEVWVLKGLPFMLRRKLRNSPSALTNVDAFMKRVKIVPPGKLQTMERFSSLDPGEQQLLSLVCDDSRIKHLITGDKRALRQISTLASSDTQLNTRLLETTVVCFESVMLGLLKSRGYSVLKARIQKWDSIEGQMLDGVIKEAFPKGGDEEFAKDILNTHVGKLRVEFPFI